MSTSVVTPRWKDWGYVPVLIGEDGRVFKEVLLWLRVRRMARDSDSVLYTSALSVARFSDCWERYSGELVPDALYERYWNSLVHGDLELGWRPVEPATAKRYLRAVNAFLDWAADQCLSRTGPNPVVETRQGWVQVLAKIDRAHRTSLLGHLFPSSKAGRGVVEQRRIDPARRSRRNAPGGGVRRKAMAWRDYIKLITNERDPRDLVAWLLFGAGGLRTSEALHLFVQDIGLDTDTQQATVRLADPLESQITVPGAEGMDQIFTRRAYLERVFGMAPREHLKPGSPQHAGWKGMQYHDKDKSWVVWLHPFFGKMMWAAHKQYMLARREAMAVGHAHHPYYLVNLKKNPGGLLTGRNLREVLWSACDRLAITSADNLHSMRHLYGITGAVRAKIDPLLMKVFMRHKSIASTEEYIIPDLETAREILSEMQDTLGQQIENLLGSVQLANGSENTDDD